MFVILDLLVSVVEYLIISVLELRTQSCYFFAAKMNVVPITCLTQTSCPESFVVVVVVVVLCP